MDDIDRYLKCTEVIDSDSPMIKEKAEFITKRLHTDKEKAIALFYFVRDEIRHNPYAPAYVPEYCKASVILREGNGICQHKAILLTALARAVGIPARIGFVDVYDHLLSDSFREMAGGTNLLSLHGYAELYVNGTWLHVSPSYNLEKCQKCGFIPVDFDGENDAKDSPYDKNGKPHIEHVKDHGTFDDFPWDYVLGYIREFVARMGLDFDDLMETGQRIREGKGWGNS